MTAGELMAAVYGGPGLWLLYIGNSWGWVGLILGLFILWMHGETLKRNAAATPRKKK